MRDLFGDFFVNKTILITGHTGFMGSWLAIWLKELGAKVIGYSLPPYTNEDNYVVTNLENQIINIYADIRNFNTIQDVFKKYSPGIIFHLAAQPIVRKSYKIPKETYDINVGGTVNVFEAFRQEKDSKILINVTSDKSYENQESTEGYCEEDRLGGYDPYSSSKTCSELITSAYRTSFFNKKSLNHQKLVASVRSGNIIGGGDWQEDRLIPDCIRAIKNNVAINIRNPKAVRPWQFVLEPLRGYLMLAIKLFKEGSKFTGAWNFGPGVNSIISVEEIVKKIINYLGKGSYNVKSSNIEDDLHETKILILDSTKSNKHLKWNCVLNIDEIIEFLCDWYFSSNLNYDYDVNQIKRYTEKIIT